MCYQEHNILILVVIKNTVISASSNMAEGGFEMDDAAFDDAMDDLADGAEKKTEFIDEFIVYRWHRNARRAL